MKTKPSKLQVTRHSSLVAMFLLLTAYCLLPVDGLYAQSAEEFEAQIVIERRRSDGPVQAREGTLSQPPNPGSIHVNRNVVYRGYTPQQLVENIFVKGGACVSVSNVQLRAHGWDGSTWTETDKRGLGYFSRGTSNFEFAEGLVMSTGGLVSIEGYNSSGDGVTFPASTAVAGDTHLQTLVTQDVTNVSVLTFDFVPAGNVIQFRYVFASEEYLHYVGYSFNDVFGFFITGPGISGTQNIATLPTSTSGDNVVSINNVNAGHVSFPNHNCPSGTYVTPSRPPVNPQYYINIPLSASTCIVDPFNNLPPAEVALMQSMEFNGRTVVLTASATVTPCQTYSLKLAVGNVVDNAFQSGVFLEAYSFNMGDNIINYGNGIEGMDIVYRGCATNKFVVTRPTADPTPLTVSLTYGGTAVNGTDVALLAGGALPATVTIPAGSSSVDVPYRVGTLTTGYRTLTITSNCPCSGAAFIRMVHIYDPSPGTDFQAITSPACPGTNSGRIYVTGNGGGCGHYESSINGGVTWVSSLLGHSGLAPGSYTVHARDSGSCFTTVLPNVVVATASPTVNAGPNQTRCGNVFTMAAQPLMPGQTGRWTVVSGAATVTNILSPTSGVTVSGSSATLRWTLIYSPDCQIYNDVTLTVIPNASVSLSASPSALCSGNPSTLTATVLYANPSSTTYTWYVGATPLGTTTTNTYTTAPLSASGSYTVQINDGVCTGTSNAVAITVTPTVTPSVNVIAAPN